MIVLGIFVATQISETRSKKKTVRMEADYYLRSYMYGFNAPSSTSFFVPKPSSPFINIYYNDDLLPDWAKAELSSLEPGEYYRSNDKQNYHIIIRNLPDGERFYMLYNVTRLNAGRESLQSLRVTLFAALTPILAVGLILGLITAHKVINPVLLLADIVKREGVDSQLPEDFERQFGDDEIGFLARTLKSTIDELHASVEREASFARDASHELRTPVTTIKSSLELINSSPLASDEKTARVIGRMERATAKMEHLIKSFLWLSRYQTIGDIDYEEMDTVTVVNDTLAEHMYLIKDKPLRVEIVEQYKQKLPVAPQVMSILIANLLRNAFTYTQSGRVRVTIKETCLQVADTGIGIKNDKLQLLRKSAGKYHAEGFGFGIAIVRRLCLSLNWSFFIESEPFAGTTVTLCYNNSELCSCKASKTAKEHSEHGTEIVEADA
jgi:signal transduction histidine kinase